MTGNQRSSDIRRSNGFSNAGERPVLISGSLWLVVMTVMYQAAMANGNRRPTDMTRPTMLPTTNDRRGQCDNDP